MFWTQLWIYVLNVIFLNFNILKRCWQNIILNKTVLTKHYFIITFIRLLSKYIYFSLLRLLSWVLNTDSGIPFEDGSDVIIYVAQNFEGREVVLNFLRNNADEIMHRWAWKLSRVWTALLNNAKYKCLGLKKFLMMNKTIISWSFNSFCVTLLTYLILYTPTVH